MCLRSEGDPVRLPGRGGEHQFGIRDGVPGQREVLPDPELVQARRLGDDGPVKGLPWAAFGTGAGGVKESKSQRFFLTGGAARSPNPVSDCGLNIYTLLSWPC